MFHAYIMPIATCFIYTLYHFYAFSGTNLLTRCHCASSCFLMFWFQKSCSGNILGIGRNKSQSSYFPDTYTDFEGETKGGRGPPSPGGGAVPLAAAL